MRLRVPFHSKTKSPSIHYGNIILSSTAALSCTSFPPYPRLRALAASTLPSLPALRQLKLEECGLVSADLAVLVAAMRLPSAVITLLKASE